jgi:ABC-2 type transport system ATP-binding protein
MKQRLKLASAIVHDPTLVILDEPTNGMDPGGREELLQLAQDLSRNKGMSLVFSSHLLPDVEAVCSYIVVMGAGRVITQGSIQELKQLHRQSFQVRLKTEHAPFAERLRQLGCTTTTRDDLLVVQVPDGETQQIFWKTAAEQGQQIRFLRPQQSTLEEVFLQAVENT